MFLKQFFFVTDAAAEKLILRHSVKSQLVKCLGRKSVAPIPLPNLAPIPPIDGNIIGSDILTN